MSSDVPIQFQSQNFCKMEFYKAVNLKEPFFKTIVFMYKDLWCESNVLWCILLVKMIFYVLYAF